jgi:hypothetical protein
MSNPKIDVFGYGYRHKPAPAAAEFRKGASDLAEIEQATEARPELLEGLQLRGKERYS